MRRLMVSTLFSFVTLPIIFAQNVNSNTVTVKGRVVDSVCAYTLEPSKSVSSDCAKVSANNGSPLVILRDDGTIFLPIDSKTPGALQNPKLQPYAGQRVSIRGVDYVRNGSHALVIESITASERR